MQHFKAIYHGLGIWALKFCGLCLLRQSAQLKEKETLRGESSKLFDQAVEQFTKIDELLGSQGKLKMEEKTSLKEAYDLLITIYEQKNLKDKVDVYTTKFNNVDKDH